MTFEPGTRVGDYEILGLLGAGGMGAVYRARNAVSDRVDAMKVIAGVSRSPELAERFLREIKLQARLRHPHIAPLYTAFHFQDQLIMVMELVEGATVDVHLARGPLDVATALAWTCQVLSALEYAHALGVIHRDIKPTNIAVTREGAAKLLDFGIAREIDEGGLTATGSAIGSPHYMSPEQLSGLPLDGRSDIYAVGLTLYEMVTGRQAVPGENGWAVMQAQMQAHPPAAARVNPAVPLALSQVIERAMAKRPEERYPAAGEFARALAALAGPAAGGAPPSSPGFTGEAGMALPRIGPGGAATSATGVFSADALATGRAGTPATTAAPLAGPAAELEKVLTGFLGPIARHLVRRASAESASVPELCRALAAEIPDPGERRAFLRACARQLGPEALSDTARLEIAGSSTAPPAAAPSWDPAALDRARSELAAHVGPLARIIVERAAARARDLTQLYSMLAAEIPSERDRQTFLARRPKGAGS